MTHPGARFYDGNTELHLGWHPSRSGTVSMLDGDDHGKDVLTIAVTARTARVIAEVLNRIASHVEEMNK